MRAAGTISSSVSFRGSWGDMLHAPARALLLALLLSGCIVGRTTPGPDAQLAARATAMAAAQVRRCYRSPRLGHDARQIVTVLGVRFAPDGTLAELPRVISQSGITPSNRPFAGRMAEAAILAVMRCAPLKLPPAAYAGGWDSFQLTFSPRMVA